MTVTQYTWTVASTVTVVAADIQVRVLDRAINIGANAHLGVCIRRPFQRDQKNDIANAHTTELVRAAVGQVIGTFAASEFTQGEIPWNTEFGSLLYLLRFQNNDIALENLARLHVIDALTRWEPRVLVKTVNITRKSTSDSTGPNILQIDLVYDIIRENVPGNNVIISNVEQTVTTAL